MHLQSVYKGGGYTCHKCTKVVGCTYRQCIKVAVTLTEEVAGAVADEQKNWSCLMVKGGEIGDVAGGSLEHPGPWLGSHWPGPTLAVPSCTGPPGAP